MEVGTGKGFGYIVNMGKRAVLAGYQFTELVQILSVTHVF